METRLQHLFLVGLLRLSTTCALAFGLASAAHAGPPKMDTEFFELGATAGVINFEDFSSELSYGIYGTFRSTENFFLQFHFLKSDVSESAAEAPELGSIPYTGKRTFQHYNLLLGYNVFQGEVFRGKHAGLSSLYVVAGVGDTEFLSESSFTYVAGLGYQMALSRRYTLRFDYKHYFYDSIIVDQQANGTSNANLSVGLGWTF